MINTQDKIATATDKQIEGSAKNQKRNRFWLQMAVMLPLSVIALELTLGALGVGQQEIVQPDPVLGCVHLKDKMVTWRLEGYSHEKLSTQGLRDTEHNVAKPANTYRIAVLGDSSTEGLQVSMDETYTKRLEKLLNQNLPQDLAGKNVEVINFGCSSYSTGQELMLFREQVKKFAPDMTVVLLCKGDILENTLDVLHPGKAEPRPYFYLDQAGNLQCDNGILQANHDKLANDKPINQLFNWLRAHSNIYGVASKANFSLFLVDKTYYRIAHFIQTVIQKASGKEALMQPSYPMPDKRAVSQALIGQFKKETAATGSDFILMLFPGMGLKDDDWAQTVSALKNQAATQNFGFIDLQPVIEQVKDPNSLFLQFHFSKGGHEVTARALADYLTSHKLNPQTKTAQ